LPGLFSLFFFLLLSFFQGAGNRLVRVRFFVLSCDLVMGLSRSMIVSLMMLIIGLLSP